MGKVEVMAFSELFLLEALVDNLRLEMGCLQVLLECVEIIMMILDEKDKVAMEPLGELKESLKIKVRITIKATGYNLLVAVLWYLDIIMVEGPCKVFKVAKVDVDDEVAAAII